jgi:hypothetical protein
MLGVAEHHRRARLGLPSLSSAEENVPPAERIVKVLEYDRHPNDYNTADSLTADELNKVLPKLVKELADENGVVAVGVLAVEVRGLTHPMLNASGPHDSNYRMEEKGSKDRQEVETAADLLEAESDK